MRRPILSGPILSILALPPLRISGGEETPESNVTLAPEPELREIHDANGASDTSDLELPDFSGLGDLSDDDGPIDDLGEPEPTPEPEKPKTDTPKPKEAATEKPAEKPSKTEEKPKPKTEEEPKEAAKEEGKKEGETEEHEITSEEEIEKFQAKPNAPREVHTNIKNIKTLWQKDAALARNLQKEVTELREQVKTAAPATDEQGNFILPEPVKQRLTELERLEQSILLEKSPVFAKQYVEPVTQAEQALFDFLKTHSLPDSVAEKIREAGIDNWDGWNDLIGRFRDPLNGQEVLRLRQELRQKQGVKEQAINELKSGTSKLPEQVQEQEKAQNMEWGKAAWSAFVEQAEGHEWALKKEVPADATEEDKKAIEAHNSAAEEIAKSSRERVIKCYHRDPKVTMETVFKSLQADHLSKENSRLAQELEATTKRAQELEERISKSRKAGQISRADSAPRLPIGEQPKNTGGPDLDKSADDAFDEWEQER